MGNESSTETKNPLDTVMEKEFVPPLLLKESDEADSCGGLEQEDLNLSYSFPPKLRNAEAPTAPNTPEKELRELSRAAALDNDCLDSPARRIAAFYEDSDGEQKGSSVSPERRRSRFRKPRRSPSIFLEMLHAEIDGHLAEELLLYFERFDRDVDNLISSAELSQLLCSINTDFGDEVCIKALESSLEKMLPLYSPAGQSLWSQEAFLCLMHTLQKS